MKVKICGLTNLSDSELALNLGAGALGFNFYSQSPRYIAPQTLSKFIHKLKLNGQWLVGVFVNPTVEEVKQAIDDCGINCLQFHGDETIEFIEQWKPLPCIKALRVKAPPLLAELQQILGAADYLLLDAYHPQLPGGSGVEIESSLLKCIPSEIWSRSFLAGGLKPVNVAEKAALVRPFGLDVASGVEAQAGIKSPELLRDFFLALSCLMPH